MQAIYDLTLHDAVTVLPSFEPFDDPLKNVLPSSPPLPDSSTQEELSFEKYYGVTQAEAWPVFDQLDPLEWFQQEKALADANYLTLQSQQVIKRAKESAIAIQYKLPFAMIARAALPNAKDMHGVYLTGAIHKNDAPIVLDTGASISITPYRSDFIGDLEECDVELHGLSDTVKVEGIGWVEWSIQDSFGQVAKIRTRAYLVPARNIRLFSPQAYFKQYVNEPVVQTPKCTFNVHWLKLYTVDGNCLKLNFDPGNNLPYMFLDSHSQAAPAGVSNAFLLKDKGKALEDARNLMLDSNYNLTPAQKELQLWHQRLGHCGHHWVQDLMRQRKHIVGEPVEQPLLPTREVKTSTCDAPKCAACQLAQQHRIGTGTTKKSGMEMAIRRRRSSTWRLCLYRPVLQCQSWRAFLTPTVRRAQQDNTMEVLYSMIMHLPTCTCQTKCPWAWARLSSPSMRLNGLRAQVESTSSPIELITIHINRRNFLTT